MIHVTNIHKYYGDLHILRGVSIDIEQGEVISIVGPSGAGKSTLLHIIGTLDRANEGKVIYEGTDVFQLSDKKLGRFRNKQIGFVFQFHHLLPEFTAIENVSIPAHIAGMNVADTKLKAAELLQYLGLEDRLHHKPSQLSGGEQQRVAVARALINDPKVVLADEPSGNLDSDAARELHQLFFQLRKQFNQTFIIVTHNTELADLADRKLTMKDGTIAQH
ncbi:MAG: ABC transporter ATP-binding protein [Chitinophagales bacterium]|nr:ABC transporter ATP-binding protein [Chitinophagaceae bacterium]MBP9882837.1 ABC transporter ATP-binding protein [Chitinophagales bacterium]